MLCAQKRIMPIRRRRVCLDVDSRRHIKIDHSRNWLRTRARKGRCKLRNGESSSDEFYEVEVLSYKLSVRSVKIIIMKVLRCACNVYGIHCMLAHGNDPLHCMIIQFFALRSPSCIWCLIRIFTRSHLLWCWLFAKASNHTPIYQNYMSCTYAHAAGPPKCKSDVWKIVIVIWNVYRI